MSKALVFETFKDRQARMKTGTTALYSQSKMGNAIFAAETARRYGDLGIVSVALNPGNLKSDLQRHMSPVAHFLSDWLLYPVAMGALTQLWAGTSVEGAELSGQVRFTSAYTNLPVQVCSGMGLTHPVPYTMGTCSQGAAEMQDLALGAKLWNWLEEQIKDV
ncbi:hypothetical protein FIBSPDRAFT_931383 [Athelia psychrophila]|uniref:NAD(P)-binding protein n=1 Tax=Athelia psychrophila TaxID=1759441 RepID=A0A166KIL2_9AGAM|nr:hypothetical protein FIBSPDRAFT_931383 [Fibularhizoctonia sp. CBS 109695]